MRRLLATDRRRRIGSADGAVEIKRHRFFRSTPWQLLCNMRPPLVPVLQHRLDTSNFRTFGPTIADDWAADAKPLLDSGAMSEADPFRGFSSGSPRTEPLEKPT